MSRGAAAILVTGLVVGAQVPLATSAFAADAVAGGQSSGDTLFPNQGNTGYDALHYDINMSVNVATSGTNNAVSTTTIPAATASIKAVTTAAPLSSYSFDFQGSTSTLQAATLNVDSVTVNGVAATFTRVENTTTTNATTDVHKLIITPATPVDGTFTTVVKYSGKPVSHTDTDGSSEGWNNTVDGATFVNQPVGAMTAFPNNNTPNDKATYTFTVDAPSKLTTSNTAATALPGLRDAAVVSNGELKSKTPSQDGTRTTWVWDESKPMASELSLISVGRYDTYESDIALASGRTIHEWTFIDPSIAATSQATTQATRTQLKSILDYFESKYGPYPGNSVGLVTDVVPRTINYALETQDRPFFPTSASRGTTTHELMHQWFGDDVSPADWNDIWLNEGPATYTEYQVPFESSGASLISTEDAIYGEYEDADATDDTFAAAPTAAMTEASQLFGDQTYNRGVITLEALRTSIGADNFAKLMKQYQLRYAGTSKSTANFIALAQQISGRDLTDFFHTWIYTTGKPAWPAKFNLGITGPAAPAAAGATVAYTLSSSNTGKVAQANSVITVDLSDVLDNAALGTLPSGVTVNGNTLTWAVPSTAVGATSTVSVPVTLDAGTTGEKLTAVARASTLGGTCVDCSSTVVIGVQPVTPSAAPTIIGTPIVGQTLTASTDGWATGTTFAYQWLLGGTPVTGATAATYTPDVSAADQAVTVRVTGSNGALSPVTLVSAPSAEVARATLSGTVPVLTSTPQVGKAVGVKLGQWSAGTYYAYQWAANGTNISGATGAFYTPTLISQIGQALTVTVTGTKAGYVSLVEKSDGSPIIGQAQTLSPTPVVTGSAKVGDELTVAPGTWDAGTALSYQWRADGVAIDGATGLTFTPGTGMVGAVITASVTSTKLNYATTTTTSAPTAPVVGDDLVVTPVPTITGTPKVGVQLSATSGAWDDGVALSYQWLADGAPVEGATQPTYTPGAGRVGAVITIAVTGTKVGYTTITKTSEATSPVVEGDLVATPIPSIAGAIKVGATVTAVAGDWDAGTELSYQWSRNGQPVAGATASSYGITAVDYGQTLTVMVSGTKQGYAMVYETSAPTTAVAVGTQAHTPLPVISGTVRVGLSVKAVAGAWDAGTQLHYQWLRDGRPIPGAVIATYTVAPADYAHLLTVAVTGTRPGYSAVVKGSYGKHVAAGVQTRNPKPVLSGSVKVGHPLAVRAGTHDAGTTLTYTWYANGHKVGGNTTTLKLTKAMKGMRITAKVTSTKPGYVAVANISASTAKVK